MNNIDIEIFKHESKKYFKFLTLIYKGDNKGIPGKHANNVAEALIYYFGIMLSFKSKGLIYIDKESSQILGIQNPPENIRFRSYKFYNQYNRLQRLPRSDNVKRTTLKKIILPYLIQQYDIIHWYSSDIWK